MGLGYMQEDVKIIILENRKTSLLRESPVVPVECEALYQSHEFKINFRLIEKGCGWI